MARKVSGQAMDAVLRKLGWLGRYQILQAIQFLFCNFPVAFHVLSSVFIGRRIEHKCRELVYSGKCNITYGECNVTLVSNQKKTSKAFPCSNGYQYAELQDHSTTSEWDLVCDREFLSDVPQTVLMMGMCMGAICFTSMADKYGRKPLHIGCHLGILVLGIVTVSAQSFRSFILFRFLLGACHQGTALTSRILLMELMPAENRKVTSICASFLYAVAMIVLAGIAFLMQDLPWRYLQLVLTSFSAYSLLQICFTDESLRWLAANGKVDAAERILIKAAEMNRVKESEVLAIFRRLVLNRRLSRLSVVSLRRDSVVVPEDEYSVLDFFSNKHVLKSLSINASMWAVDTLTYFGLAMTSGSLAKNMYVGFALNAVADIPGGIVFFFTIDRIGRRKCCMVSHFLAGTSLVASVLVTSLGGGEIVQMTVIVLTLIGKFAISIALATIFLYTPEQFPTNIRNLSLGMAAFAGRVGGMIAPFSRTTARRVPWLPGTIFGICCIMVSFLVRLLPETSGHELPLSLNDMIEQQAEAARLRKEGNCCC